MNKALIFAATLTATTFAAAQQSNVPLDSDLALEQEELRRYAVEVILFTYDTSVTAGTEIFEPDLPPAPGPEDPAGASGAFDGSSLAEPVAIDSGLDPDSAATEIPEYGDTLPIPDASLTDDGILEDLPLVDIVSVDGIEFERIPQDELTLVGAHEELIRIGAYRPVLWTGWTQVALPDESTPALRLRRLGPVPLELSGTLKLYLSRFLHLVVDIELEATMEQTAFGDQTQRFDDRVDSRYDRRSDDRYELGFGYRREPPPLVIRYQISEDRIVANGELRYFDHPRFGLLAKVTRIEDEDIEQDAEPAAEPEPVDTTEDLLPR